MSRRHAAALLLALSPALAGCPAASGDRPMTVHGLCVERIDPQHRVVLADGLTIDGDARLAEAVRAGGADIADIVTLELMPPVFVVTFADGETRRYQSHRTR